MPLLIALQFLTTIPIRLQRPPRPEELGQALLWYPAVGGLIGLLLAVSAQLLPASKPFLDASLLLTLWILLTGGLHLDGLGDTVDGWVGGHGDRRRTLAIMKDARSGPMAVVAISVVLLLKFAAIETLLAAGQYGPLVAAPILGRTAMPLLLAITPYVRADGIGARAAAQLPQRPAMIIVSLTLAATLVSLRTVGAAILGSCALAFAVTRACCLRRLGGVTGDCCGALLDILEAVVLLAGALSS